jgi:hypothetical protein
MLAGKTMEELGFDNFRGDLLGATPKSAFAAVVGRACKAAQDTYFRGLRAHDNARVIGVDPTLPAVLVQGLRDELSAVADEWRELGAFQPRVDVPGDAPLQDRLLGLTGRDPYAA